MNNKAYTVYSKPNCGFCVKAKDLLESRSIEFLEIDVSKDAEKLNWLKQQGFRTVPQIYAEAGDNTEYVGGYEQLVDYLSR